jgi:TolB-like protein/Tfp pilus assembly protein PilF
MTPDIFLSYTREDQAAAQRFAEAFEAQGFSVWWDVTLRSGEAYDQVTEEALRTAKAVVVLWSTKSVVSRWVRAEATLADRNRTLVPARIEGCDLPIMFELTQTADLSRWKGEGTDPAWRGFLADVRRFVEARQVVTQRPAASPAAPSRAARPSVAVLPFVNRSGHSEDDAFADGMVEDVTIALSLNPWMAVVASGATATYRQGARDLRQIGRELGVHYLLEGNIRRVGDDLRVTAQVVKAETGNILWTKRFDRPVTELAALQDELVSEVAAHLGVQVERAEVELALKKPETTTAWEAFVRSVAYLSRGTRSSFEAGVAEAKRAIEIDPNYSVAYSALATVQAELWKVRGCDDAELAQEIVGNIRKARALDPDNPVVLVGCGCAMTHLGKAQDALPLLRRAAAAAPNVDYTHAPLGFALVQLGRLDEGLAELEASERFGPNSVWGSPSSIWRSVAHLQAGRFDQALEAVDQALLLLPGNVEALLQNMLCLAKLADWNRAGDTLRRLRDADPEVSGALAEKFVRQIHSGSSAEQVEEYVAIVRKLWGEIP